MAVLFSDGFELGNFGAWTSTTGAPAIVEIPIHHGTYAAQFNATTERCTKTISAVNTVYMRFYVQWTTNPTTVGARQCLGGLNDLTGTYTPYLELINVAGVVTWRLVYRNAAWSEAYLTSVNPAPTINTWYCIEIYHNAGANTEFWIDGVSKGSSVNVVNTAKNSAYVGTRHITADSNAVTIDCVVVADAYIGPESAGVSVKKGSSVASTMTQMLSSKMLFSQCNPYTLQV